MVCPECNTNTPGIKLNNKLYCTQCGAILPEKETPALDLPATPPEAKIIAPDSDSTEKLENEIDQLGAELNALNEIEHKAETEEKLKDQTTELRTLEAAEKLVDSLDFTVKDPKEKETKEKTIIKAERERVTHHKNVSEESATEPEKPIEQIPQIPENPLPISPEENAPKKVEEIEHVDTPAEENITINAQSVEDLPQENLPNESEPLPTVVEEEPPNEQPESKEKLAINFIQAEKGYCVKCKALRDINDPENVMMKNGHPALRGKCSVCGTTIFKILKGAIDPKYKSQHKKPDITPKGQFLTGFFKENVNSINRNEKSENKKPKKFSWRIFLAITIPCLLILGFVGLVVYVNIFALDADRARTKAESTVSFNYQKPGYVPAGYVLSPETAATPNQIIYSYNLVTVTSNGKETVTDTFEIDISKFDGSKEEAYENYVRNTGKTFGQESLKGTEVYFIEDKNVVFYNDGVIYEISSSGKISRGELLKIAGGFIK